MKKYSIGITLVLTIAAITALTACKTVVTFSGAAIQFVGCQLAKAKPAAKGPLLAGGNVFLMFGQTTTPTEAQLRDALAAIPSIGLEQVEITAMWDGVCIVWGQLYNAVKSPEDKANLQAALTTIGQSLVNASTCGGTVAQMGTTDKPAPTWAELGDAIRAELKKAK